MNGIDSDPTTLAAASSRAAIAGVHATFSSGEVERLPFRNASLDAIVSITAPCFVPDAATAVREMARVRWPAGRRVLGDLGRGSLCAPIRRVRAWLGSSTGKAAWSRAATGLRERALARLDTRFRCPASLGAALVALAATCADERSAW